MRRQIVSTMYNNGNNKSTCESQAYYCLILNSKRAGYDMGYTTTPPPPFFQKEHIKLRENLKFCPVLSKIQLFKNVKIY